MKYVVTTIILLVFTVCLNAQNGINYKAIIKDGSGTVVANDLIVIQFQILQGAAMNNVYQEIHTPITDVNGIIIVNIGEGTSSDDFNTIDWELDNHFLNVKINTGDGLIDLGTTGFRSVPYALYAETAGASVTEAQTLANVVALGNSADGQLKNVSDPTDQQDAATKAYVDLLEARITALEQTVVGDTRAGGVVFWVDPTDNTHGLVCAFSDFTSTQEWGCFPTDLPSVPNVASNGGNPLGPGSRIGDGLSNTNGILTDCPDAPAALAARSLGPDWFLPSINELKEIHLNKSILESVPGFSALSSIYISSTEVSNERAWIQSMGDGTQSTNPKNLTIFVRAIRAF